MKSFCILEQGKSVNDPLTLEKKRLFSTCHSDFYRLNWKRSDDPNAFLTATNVVWSEGRSLLYEHVPKNYLYYIFIDDDVQFRSTQDCDVPARIAEFFLSYNPVAGTFYDPQSWAFHGASKDDRSVAIAHPICGFDLQLHFLRRDFADLVLPCIYHGSDGSMRYAQWLAHHLAPNQQLCFRGVSVRNALHEPHEDGITNRRAHARQIMAQFNRDTFDGSFDGEERWSRDWIVRTNDRVRNAPIGRATAPLTIHDLSRVYNTANAAYSSRRCVADPGRSSCRVHADRLPRAALDTPDPGPTPI